MEGGRRTPRARRPPATAILDRGFALRPQRSRRLLSGLRLRQRGQYFIEVIFRSHVTQLAFQVGELGIERELVNMLSRSTDRDEIVNRVCRLMGNLSAEKIIAEKLHKEEALAALLKVIDNAKTPMPTLLLAVRAIRY